MSDKERKSKKEAEITIKRITIKTLIWKYMQYNIYTLICKYKNTYMQKKEEKTVITIKKSYTYMEIEFLKAMNATSMCELFFSAH